MSFQLIDYDQAFFLIMLPLNQKKSPLFKILNNYNSKTSTIDIFNIAVGKFKPSLAVYDFFFLFFFPLSAPFLKTTFSLLHYLIFTVTEWCQWAPFSPNYSCYQFLFPNSTSSMYFFVVVEIKWSMKKNCINSILIFLKLLFFLVLINIFYDTFI